MKTQRSLKSVAVAAALAVLLPAVSTAGFLDAFKGMLGGSGGGGGAALSQATIADGLREALRVGTERVVAQLGKPGGFSADPSVHIPLPGVLANVQSSLAMVGASGMADKLEAKLNSAAEAAMPEAREVFWQAISQMTLDDAMAIYNGPEDSATSYFRGKMTPELAQRMAPIVRQSLSEVGAVATFDSMMQKYQAIPLVPKVDTDLTGYVVDKALDGTFHYVALEEAAIRQDPAARTTELLRKVFGSEAAVR